MRGAVHMQITTIGLDIAKNVFQVHGIDATEKVVVRKQLRRSQVLAFFKALPPCLVGMEACATAHYWARELTKLGHKVRLMPDHIRASSHCGCIAMEAILQAKTGHTWLRPNASRNVRFLLHRGRRPYMARKSQLVHRSKSAA